MAPPCSPSVRQQGLKNHALVGASKEEADEHKALCGLERFNTGLGDLYYKSNKNDPYIVKNNDDDDGEDDDMEIEDMTIKSIDIVIVCAHNEDGFNSLKASQKLSGVAGSPAYVAPEVLSGSYSEKVDIWGAGVLLHVLLLGSLPFQGGSLEAVFEAIKIVDLDFNSGPWESMSVLGRDLISRMLDRDISSRITADQVLCHPWVLFYTECTLKAVTTNVCVTNKIVATKIPWDGIRSHCESSASDSSSQRSEDQDECGIVDALTATITHVRISEPKRTRLCNPAIPIQQECSANLKSNLCKSF